MIEIYFDGGNKNGNPSWSGGFGAVIKRDGTVIRRISNFVVGECVTNNSMEYEALLRALSYVKSTPFSSEDIKVYGDSQLVIKQMTGLWDISDGVYRIRAERAREEVKKMRGTVTFQWIPREENKEADALVNMGLKRIKLKKRNWRAVRGSLRKQYFEESIRRF